MRSLVCRFSNVPHTNASVSCMNRRSFRPSSPTSNMLPSTLFLGRSDSRSTASYFASCAVHSATPSQVAIYPSTFKFYSGYAVGDAATMSQNEYHTFVRKSYMMSHSLLIKRSTKEAQSGPYLSIYIYIYIHQVPRYAVYIHTSYV